MSPSENPIDFDFGEFSLRSLGITANIPASLDHLLPTVGGYLLASDSLDDRLQLLKKALEQETGMNARFTLMGYATLFPHELKHYHDYLASPYGARLMVNHALAASYFFVVLHALAGEPTIGMPLQAWESLSDASHAVYRKQTRSGQFGRRPPATTQRFTRTVESILGKVSAWQSKLEGHPDARLTTTHIVEAAAVQVQSVQLIDLFGFEQASSFFDTLGQADTERTYTMTWDLWQALDQALPGESGVSPAIRNAILFYALCGPHQAEVKDPAAHPAGRLYLLVTHLMKQGQALRDDTILDALDAWAADHGQLSLAESLKESAQFCRQFGEGLRKICYQNEQIVGQELYPDALFEAYDAWVGAHEYMVAQILPDPMAYLDPVRYLVNAKRWVAAPIYYATSAGIFQSGNPIFERARQAGWTPIWGQGQEGEIQVCRMIASPYPSAGQAVLSNENAWALSIFIWQTYLLWSYGMLSQLHRQVAAMVFRMGSEREVLLL